MRRRFKIFLTGLFLALPWIGAASAAEVDIYCLVSAGPPLHWAPCSSANPVATSSGPTSDTTASGSVTSTQDVPITLSGQSTVGTQVTGTWTGNLLFEGTVDGTNWIATTGVNLATGASTGSTTANGVFQSNAAGLIGFRVRGSNVATGTAVISLRGSTGVSTIMSDNPLVIAQQLGITPTDRTITSATGSSQQMMAGNASRHSMTIVNTGNANCGVNPTGGTAAIGGAGTITLGPLGAYTPRVPTLSAVTVICTAGQPIYGDEN